MFLGVQELEVRKIHFDVDFPPGEIDFGDNQLRQVTPLHTEGTAELLSNTLGEIRIRGRLGLEMEGQCHRCLEPVPIRMDSGYDLFYRPATEGGPGEQAIDAGESEIGFYEGGGIELSEVMREYVLLELPMRQVCKEQCLGMCPVCGKNRNLGDCTCEVKRLDDRWAALRDIKIDTPAQG